MKETPKEVKEASVIINGVILTSAQVTTLRGAINSFHSYLLKDELGDDEHGKIMTKLHIQNIHKINSIIHSK